MYSICYTRVADFLKTVQHLYNEIFSFVWLGLTKVSQTAAGKNLWTEPRKYPQYHVRNWTIDFITQFETLNELNESMVTSKKRQSSKKIHKIWALLAVLLSSQIENNSYYFDDWYFNFLQGMFLETIEIHMPLNFVAFLLLFCCYSWCVAYVKFLKQLSDWQCYFVLSISRWKLGNLNQIAHQVF